MTDDIFDFGFTAVDEDEFWSSSSFKTHTRI